MTENQRCSMLPLSIVSTVKCFRSIGNYKNNNTIINDDFNPANTFFNHDGIRNKKFTPSHFTYRSEDFKNTKTDSRQ